MAGHVDHTAACDESSVLMAAQEEPKQDVIAPYSAPQGGEVRQTHGCKFLCQALKATYDAIVSCCVVLCILIGDT